MEALRGFQTFPQRVFRSRTIVVDDGTQWQGEPGEESVLIVEQIGIAVGMATRAFRRGVDGAFIRSTVMARLATDDSRVRGGG